MRTATAILLVAVGLVLGGVLGFAYADRLEGLNSEVQISKYEALEQSALERTESLNMDIETTLDEVESAESRNQALKESALNFDDYVN